MTFSFVNDTRQLAKSILVADFSDAEIQKELDAATAKIYGLTQKSDWDSEDVQFEYINKLIIKQAAIWVLEHRDTSSFDNILSLWKEEVNTGITLVGETITDPAQDVDIIVVASDYVSYPLALEDDDQAIPYRSTYTSV
jgi:uncharacterized membrane protein YheB (UPF0754 family)